ncbi:MAG: hypothetical protein IPG88_11055 [Gemmatimonadetes bacterium]|nr:hypothetical protein [Gemmatimonadota bacterium]
MLACSDHSLVVITDLTVDATQLARLRQATIHELSASFPAPLLHEERGERGKDLLFQDAWWDIGDDVHPSIAAALGAAGRGSIDRRCPMLELTTAARNALNGVLVRPPRDPRTLEGYTNRTGIDLSLGVEARDRLALQEERWASDSLTVHLTAARLLTLSSGLAFLLLELSVDSDTPFTSEVLSEALGVLAPSRRGAKLAFASIAAGPARPTFSIDDVLRALVAPAHIAHEPWSRYFTYVFATCEPVPPPATPGATTSARQAISQLAWRLSRHYTGSYQVRHADVEHGVYLPFDDVAHAVNLEGAALVAYDNATFVREGGLRARFESVYLALVMLAYHAHVVLIELAQVASAWHAAHPALNDPAPLQTLMDAFLRFRLAFRLPLASDITMHNRVFAMAREAFNLEELQLKASQDVAELERHVRFLRAAHEAKEAHTRERAFHVRERDRAGYLGLLAGMLAFLSSHAAIKEVIKTIKAVVAGAGQPIADAAGQVAPSKGSIVADVIAIFGAFLMAWLAWRLTSERQKDEHRDEGLHPVGHGHGAGHVGAHVGDELLHEGTLTAVKALRVSAQVTLSSGGKASR